MPVQSCSPRYCWTVSAVLELQHEQVPDQGTCSATDSAVHLPSKCVSPKQQGGNHLPVFCLLISSSASHLAFLYSNGKFLSSWFPKEGLTSSCFACTFLEWFHPPFWPFLFRCNSGPLWLCDFFPIYFFFFFFPGKRMKRRVRTTSYAFFSLFPCLPSSIAHKVVIHGAFCQSSGWVWLTPEHSVPCLLFCGTAQDPFWYSFEMV